MGNFRFPVKFKLPNSKINALVLRDHFKRLQFAEHEVTQRALKYIARNSALPAKARLEAQLQLASMPHYTRFTAIKDRCYLTGTSRGMLKGLGINRVAFKKGVSLNMFPGVRKSVW